LAIAALVMLGVAIHAAWNDVRKELSDLTVGSLLAALVALGCAWSLTYVGWRRMLGALGARWQGPADGLSTFSAAQLGKYIPGAVWPAVIQADMGRRHGLGWRVMLTGYSLLLVISVSTGTAVGLLVLTGDTSDWLKVAVVAAAVLGALMTWAAVTPSKAHRWIDQLLARFTGAGLPTDLDHRQARTAAALVGTSWLFLGLQAFCIAWALGARFSDLGLVVGGFVFSSIVGLAVVPLPAGIGVREAVLVATLGPALGRPGAITVALVARLLQVAFDGVAGIATGAPRVIRFRRRDSVPTS
jgi:uncharacterized membrane protein YbhN (UPF0104 family)